MENASSITGDVISNSRLPFPHFTQPRVDVCDSSLGRTKIAQKEAERRRRGYRSPFSTLKRSKQNKKSRLKMFLPFFIAIQFTRETNLSFFHDVEKEILEIFALENCIIVSWNFSLFSFFLFFSRKRNNEIIRKNFHFFFFFTFSRIQKSCINFNSR